MIANKKRVFRFTSSNIWKLTKQNTKKDGFGAPALTYIEEVRAQRCLGRGIDTGAKAQSLTWGIVAEYYCHKFELGIEYELCSSETLIHFKYPFWSGSQDVRTKTKTGELKCFYPKRFYELSKALIQLNEGLLSLDEFKKNEEEVYWQVVSNAILNKHSIAEIMAYTPTEGQLFAIRKELEDDNYIESLGMTLREYLGISGFESHFIFESPIEKLPYIPDGIEWPNFVKFTFEVPTEDIIFLTKCVCNAEKLLTDE